jgi:hypothetical protein
LLRLVVLVVSRGEHRRQTAVGLEEGFKRTALEAYVDLAAEELSGTTPRCPHNGFEAQGTRLAGAKCAGVQRLPLLRLQELNLLR